MIKLTLFAALLTASALASAATNPLYSAPYSAPTKDEVAVLTNPLYQPYSAPTKDEVAASPVVLAVNNPLYRGN